MTAQHKSAVRRRAARTQAAKDEELRKYQRERAAEDRVYERYRPNADPRMLENGIGSAMDPTLPRAWRRPAK